MKNILFIGDCASSSGFGRASHGFIPMLAERHHVTCIGINYYGTRHELPIWVYPAQLPGADPLGLRRLPFIVPIEKPDLVVIQTNPWFIVKYMQALKSCGYEGPVVGIIAVEGKNCDGRPLNYLTKAIFWNEFSLNEARQGGFKKPGGVVPLGVDLTQFYPGDKEEARKKIGLPDVPPGSFIVGNVNRNQFRKRIDLSLIYFAEWIKTRKIRDAYLYLHLLPGSTPAIDVAQLSLYLGINERVIFVEPTDMFNGAPIEYLRASYQCFDVQISTALGEGHGLTAMEGMACGIPQIGGDYSAFSEWAKGFMYLIPCYAEGVMPDVNSMIGGIPDKDEFIKALDLLYSSKEERDFFAKASLACANQPQYRWEEVARRFTEEIEAGFGNQ
jgi:glycosyltransferase involved in cell wall biosynthesis